MRFWAAGALMLMVTACYAQSPDAPLSVQDRSIGTVAPADADVIDAAGNLAAAPAGGASRSLIGGETVKANDHTAAVRLARGGRLLVCENTRVHMADSADESLLLGLDRGAMEVRTDARAGDVVMTPDLRFTMSEAAPLDLQMRVTSAGDTCVDNRGHRAPTLKISDAFGESTYELKPGQHVTFEHGSLREVVDRETVPCGCPPEQLKRGSLADAMVAGGGTGYPATPAEKAAEEHPFPAAVSEGLEPAPAPAPDAAQETHVKVSATLGYDPTVSTAIAAVPARTQDSTPVDQPSTKKASPTRTQPTRVQPDSKPQTRAPQPVRPQQSPQQTADGGRSSSQQARATAHPRNAGGPFIAVGRFFKRLFVR